MLCGIRWNPTTRRTTAPTKNEFIEKAIRFYSGYLDAESADAYLPRVLADVLEGKLGALGKRMGHLLFKLAVEENLMGNLLAAGMEWIWTRCERHGSGA